MGTNYKLTTVRLKSFRIDVSAKENIIIYVLVYNTRATYIVQTTFKVYHLLNCLNRQSHSSVYNLNLQC